MAMPKPDMETKAFFSSVMPEGPGIQVKPMFGQLAGFVNGNMFTGLYGQQVFVRLPEAERIQLIEQEGAAEFSPMPGKPMKEYVVLPEEWRQKPDNVREWLNRSLIWVSQMPEKVPARKPKTSKKQ